MTTPLNTVFLPHGGGPWPFIDGSKFGSASMYAQMRTYLEGLSASAGGSVQALLLVSAHWEAPVPTVMTAARPGMLYDYYGFEPKAYEVQWPAPGAPELAADVRRRLSDAGFDTAEDAERGFDHGTFVPMKLAYPNAEVPCLQLSLQAGLDPAVHFEIGRALAPLRQSGVFIVGSGMSYHNLPAFRAHLQGGETTIEDDSRRFDDWLAETMAMAPDARRARLLDWASAPGARQSHPREEHLLPLMVAAGAAENEVAAMPYRDQIMGAHVSAVHFG